MLDRVESIIRWTNHAGGIQSQMACINRGCEVYGMLSDLMEHMKTHDSLLRMPFYYEVVSVLKAMLIAYGLMESDSVKDLYGEEGHYGSDVEWIRKMASDIRTHWEKEHSYFDQFLHRPKTKIKVESPSIAEQIKEAEEENRQIREKYPDLFRN